MLLNDGEQVTITDFLGHSHRYRVVHPLGDGYLADVYLVRDVQDSSSVVTKVLKQQHINAANKTSDFLREADFLQQLRHRPEVVQLESPGKGEIDLDEQTRLPCILQEYVTDPYRPLPEIVEAGLDEEMGLEICRQFASLLSYVHTLGIVYTDLKPEHIYWNGRQIKVIDWNVAKDLSREGGDALRDAVAKEIGTFGRVMYYLFTGQSTVSRIDGPSITTPMLDTFSGTHVEFQKSTTGEILSLGTRLTIERALQEDGGRSYTSAVALEKALNQNLLRLSSGDRDTHTRAAITKGQVAMEAADYEDAAGYFEEAVYNSPGLITQTYLIAARVMQDESLSNPTKDKVKAKLALFREAFEAGDLTTARDALASSQADLPECQVIEVLGQLATEVARAVIQAEEALAAGDYEAAEKALRRARELEPSASVLRERLQAVKEFGAFVQAGDRALEAGQFADAATAYEAILNHPLAALSLGFSTSPLRRFQDGASSGSSKDSGRGAAEDSRRHWRRREQPGERDVTIEQRWVAAKLGEAQNALEQYAFDVAQQVYEAILQRQPDSEEARLGLSAVEEGRQRFEQVESHLTQGRTAFRVGDYEKALQCINAALELEPEHAGVRQLLADVREAQQIRRSQRIQRWLEKGHGAMTEGNYAEAIRCFEQAAALDPEGEAGSLRAWAETAQVRSERFRALLHKAEAAFQGKDYDAAVQYFEEAMDLNPEAADARRGLTLARQRQAEVKAQEVQSRLARGRASLSAGKYDEALNHFERASELTSDSEIADYIDKTFRIRDLVQSARSAEARGELQEAIQYYTRAVDTEPLPGLEQELTRLRTQVKASNHQQVNELLERAAAALASAPAKAMTWLRQAQALDPDREEVAELLLEVEERLQSRQTRLRRLLETGQTALGIGDATTAEQVFADAQTLEPEHEEALAGHARAQQLQQYVAAAESAINQQDYETAAAELDRAMEIAPDSVHLQEMRQHTRSNALLQRARQAAAAGAYVEALELVDEAIEQNPEYTAGLELKQTIQAKAEAARQATIEALMARAESRIDAHDYAGGLEAIESALEIMPDNAGLASRRRRVAQEKALQDRAQSLMDQARRFEMRGQFTKAVEAYEVAARLTPDPVFEARLRARVEQVHRSRRRKRWLNLLRRIVGFSSPLTED